MKNSNYEFIMLFSILLYIIEILHETFTSLQVQFIHYYTHIEKKMIKKVFHNVYQLGTKQNYICFNIAF